MELDFLKPNCFEFFHDGTDLVFMENGVKKSFFDLPDPQFHALEARLANRPLACWSLDDLGITDPVERVKKFTTCNHGDFNTIADFIGSRCNDQEYYDCGQRGTCKYEGKLCDKIVVLYGVLSESEIRVLRQLSLAKTDKEIADSLFTSPYTVSTHIRNMISKTGASNRVGLAMVAARFHL